MWWSINGKIRTLDNRSVVARHIVIDDDSSLSIIVPIVDIHTIYQGVDDPATIFHVVDVSASKLVKPKFNTFLTESGFLGSFEVNLSNQVDLFFFQFFEPVLGACGEDTCFYGFEDIVNRLLGVL